MAESEPVISEALDPTIFEALEWRRDTMRQLEEQGINPFELNPNAPILAAHSPEEIKNSLWAAFVGGGFNNQVGFLGRRKLNQLESAQRSIEATHEQYIKLALRRGRYTIPLTGLVTGALFLFATGQQDYSMDAYYSGKPPDRIGTPLLPHNTLTYDPSILPGTHGRHIPIIGALLKHVPGVPDMGAFKEYETKQVTKLVPTHHVTFRAKNSHADARNPIARDLKLSGLEYAQDLHAASAVLHQARRQHTSIKTVKITGLASDEFAGRVGVPDRAQQKLAVARAAVAKTAFVDEAEHLHIALPKRLDVAGHEAVLTTQEVAAVKSAAREQSMDTTELLIAHERHERLPRRVNHLLNQLLDRERGSRYRVSGIARHTESIPKHETVTEKGALTGLDSVPGEVLLFGMAIPGMMMGLLWRIMRMERDARRFARRDAKRAGFVFK